MQLLTLTVKDALVENLRDEIIKGRLRPGQKLRQEELATYTANGHKGTFYGTRMHTDFHGFLSIFIYNPCSSA
jgi:hypothetical protein